MLNKIVAEILAAQEPLQVLALCTKKEIERLKVIGLPITTEDCFLSMQQLKASRLAAESLHQGKHRLQVLGITPNEENTTEEERALIYAMLVRCRKVISCRDKLEDMLKYDDREGWYTYKQEYETKVLDTYKMTWRDKIVYPYNIVDNIKEYNKDEGYILKALYTHLSERKPGHINEGDAAMANKLRKMFSDIGLAILNPQIILVGDIEADEELTAVLKKYSKLPNIKIIKI